MTRVIIDTYRIAQRLQEKGFTREQTEGLLAAAREVDLDRIVTREYLELRLSELESRLTLRMGAMIFTLGGFLVAVKFLS